MIVNTVTKVSYSNFYLNFSKLSDIPSYVAALKFYAIILHVLLNKIFTW